MKTHDDYIQDVKDARQALTEARKVELATIDLAYETMGAARKITKLAREMLAEAQDALMDFKEGK